MNLDTRLYNLQVAWMNDELDTHQLKLRLFIITYPHSGMVQHWLTDCGV